VKKNGGTSCSRPAAQTYEWTGSSPPAAYIALLLHPLPLHFGIAVLLLKLIYYLFAISQSYQDHCNSIKVIVYLLINPLWVEKFFFSSITSVYSDGGRDYTSLTKRLSNMVIQHLLSPPYTTQRICIAERRHRHIMETALALLHQASVPLAYWLYASSTAVYLINSTSILKWKKKKKKGQSPYESIFHTSPTYTILRTFGFRPCSNHKLDPKSRPCVFFGY